MIQSRISVITGRAKDTQTDHLYEPLRKTFLADTTAKKSALDSATKVSHVSNTSHARNIFESHQLGQRTLIPEDAKLVRCYDLQKIPKNHKYCVVNTDQKQLSPISPEELEKRMKGKNQEIIVYTYGERNQILEPEGNIFKLESGVPKLESKLESKSYEFKKSTVRESRKKKEPKYNLFSVIDEGINNMFKGESCTCPANEIIAQQQQEIRWEGLDKN